MKKAIDIPLARAMEVERSPPEEMMISQRRSSESKKLGESVLVNTILVFVMAAL